MWQMSELAELAARALRAHAESLDLEQAVHGLDSLEEVDLHPILATGCADGGYGVERECHYPSQWEHLATSSTRMHPRDRLRCDLVLTPSADAPLIDPLAIHQESNAMRDAGVDTLFASHAEDDAAAHAPDPTHTPPEDACWIEVKTVGQHCCRAGVPGPNATYASELIRGMSLDVDKLACEDRIACGCVMLVLFTARRDVAEHDTVALLHKCLDLELPVGSYSTTAFPITDRIGNAWCTVCVVPVRRL